MHRLILVHMECAMLGLLMFSKQKNSDPSKATQSQKVQVFLVYLEVSSENARKVCDSVPVFPPPSVTVSISKRKTAYKTHVVWWVSEPK